MEALKGGSSEELSAPVFQNEEPHNASSPSNQDTSWSFPLQDADVLFGRGRPLQSHPGNLRMNRIAKQFQSLYQQSERGLKAEIVKNVVCIVRDTSSEGTGLARFLKRKNRRIPNEYLSPYSGEWTEATENEVIAKVSHILREKPRTPRRSASLEVEAKKAATHQDGNTGTAAKKRIDCTTRVIHEHSNKVLDRGLNTRQPFPGSETYYTTSRDISSTIVIDSVESDEEFYADCLHKYFCDFDLCEPGTPPSPSIFDDLFDEDDAVFSSHPSLAIGCQLRTKLEKMHWNIE